VTNMTERAYEASDAKNPINCVYEFLAGGSNILNVEIRNGQIDHIYFCGDHAPQRCVHTRLSPIDVPSSYSASVVIRGSHEINGTLISDLINKFAKSDHPSLKHAQECAYLFCVFLEATFGRDKPSQTNQLKRLTASYYSEIYELIPEWYREDLLKLKWRPDLPSPFYAPISAKENQWLNVAVSKPFQGKFRQTVRKLFSHVFEALDVASGDFGLTELDGLLLINMVIARLCSTVFSPIKSSIFFIGYDADGNVSVAKLVTDGVFAGHLKANVNVLERRDQMPASNVRVIN
jgi:hypothetical protein